MSQINVTTIMPIFKSRAKMISSNLIGHTYLLLVRCKTEKQHGIMHITLELSVIKPRGKPVRLMCENIAELLNPGIAKKLFIN